MITHFDALKCILCVLTRWSSRADATKSFRKSYEQIKDALLEYDEDPHQKADTRNEAASLADKLDDFEMALLTIVWDDILQRINQTSKSLQEETIHLGRTADLYNALIEYIKVKV